MVVKRYLSSEYRRWLTEFEMRKGRPLRILHIGNVANNAFYIAKFLNQAGIHADVFAHENYHMMSSPEWEEVEFSRLPKDQYFPDWWNIAPGYEHPDWFAQGPWKLCIQYLEARLSSNRALEKTLGARLAKARQWAYLLRGLYRFALRSRQLLPEAVVSRIKSASQKLFHRAVSWHVLPSRKSQLVPQQTFGNAEGSISWGPNGIVNEFARRFPDRDEQLSMTDIDLFYGKAQTLKPLFKKYDIVHAYGTDVIYPLLAGSEVYVAFEHGTLRDVPHAPWDYKGPFFPNAVGRLTALAYTKAAHVFVTNADTLPNVLRLGIPEYTPIGHPFEDNCCDDTSRSVEIRSQIGADLLFLCPIRHDWSEKGTDRYIRALPLLRKALGNRFKVCFTPWGQEVDRSKRLISELGCDDLVRWVGPFGRIMFNHWLAAADIVFDQLRFSSFSGTTPRSLACGVPVIVRYDHQVCKWMFPDPPPVLTAETSEEIVSQTIRALDGKFRQEYRVQARDWIKKHHSVEVLLDKLLGVYKDVLSA